MQKKIFGRKSDELIEKRTRVKKILRDLMRSFSKPVVRKVESNLSWVGHIARSIHNADVKTFLKVVA